MKVLALNCGSSSVKCQLFETSLEEIAANRDRQLGRVVVDRIGTPEVPSHREAIQSAVETLMKGSNEEIEAVGHRVVHGGEQFSAPVELDDATALEIEGLNELAPLHNPVNLKGYRAARAVLPQARHVAVFDTAKDSCELIDIPDESARAFRDYQVNDALFAQARPDAVFMHCLPAKRDEEVTDSIMEHPRSVVFDQAENRLHAQKALLLMMLT